MKELFFMKMVVILVVVTVFFSSGCESPFWPQLQHQQEEPEIIVEENGEQPVPFADIQRGATEDGTAEDMRINTLYFAAGKGRYLVPVQLNFPPTEGVARATLEKLIEGPSPGWEMRYGLEAVLPSATKVLGLTIRDGHALVDLSRELLDYEREQERLILDALVYTITQFDTVDRVSFIVEGEKLEELPGGVPAEEGWGRERGINVEVADSVEDFAEADRINLYFCLPAGDKVFYLPVTRVVPRVDEEELPRTVLQELLAGPRRGSGLFSDIPPEVAIRGVSWKENILEVNFSSAFTAYRGGMKGAENMLNQISLTMTELPGVEEIKILVDGHEVILPDGISLLTPLKRPQLYNFLK